jgi:hypothetical protein
LRNGRAELRAGAGITPRRRGAPAACRVCLPHPATIPERRIDVSIYGLMVCACACSATSSWGAFAIGSDSTEVFARALGLQAGEAAAGREAGELRYAGLPAEEAAAGRPASAAGSVGSVGSWGEKAGGGDAARAGHNWRERQEAG